MNNFLSRPAFPLVVERHFRSPELTYGIFDLFPPLSCIVFVNEKSIYLYLQQSRILAVEFFRDVRYDPESTLLCDSGSIQYKTR